MEGLFLHLYVCVCLSLNAVHGAADLFRRSWYQFLQNKNTSVPGDACCLCDQIRPCVYRPIWVEQRGWVDRSRVGRQIEINRLRFCCPDKTYIFFDVEGLVFACFLIFFFFFFPSGLLYLLLWCVVPVFFVSFYFSRSVVFSFIFSGFFLSFFLFFLPDLPCHILRCFRLLPIETLD